MEHIKTVLKEFEGLAVSHEVIIDDDDEDGLYRYKLIVFLKNSSKVAVEERLNRLGYQYSYHWMEADNTLIIRWDNAPRHLASGIHHKHVGSKQNVHPSEEMTLRKVLAYIAKTLGIF